MAHHNRSERIAIGDLVVWFQDRATLDLMLIFGILHILLNPPGISVILGLPMLYLSLARMLGRPPWFPGTVTRRGLSTRLVAALASRANPGLGRAVRGAAVPDPAGALRQYPSRRHDQAGKLHNTAVQSWEAEQQIECFSELAWLIGAYLCHMYNCAHCRARRAVLPMP